MPVANRGFSVDVITFSTEQLRAGELNSGGDVSFPLKTRCAAGRAISTGSNSRMRGKPMAVETYESRRIIQACLALALLLPTPTAWAAPCPAASSTPGSRAVGCCQGSSSTATFSRPCNCNESTPVPAQPALPASIEAEHDDAFERPGHDLGLALAPLEHLIVSPHYVERACRAAHNFQLATSAQRCVVFSRWII